MGLWQYEVDNIKNIANSYCDTYCVTGVPLAQYNLSTYETVPGSQKQYKVNQYLQLKRALSLNAKIWKHPLLNKAAEETGASMGN